MAGQAAPYIGAVAGKDYADYASNIGQMADQMPLNLQNLKFSFKHLGKDINKAAHKAAPVAKAVYKDTKVAGKLVGKAAPVIGMIGGPEAGAASLATGAIATALPLQNLNNQTPMQVYLI